MYLHFKSEWPSFLKPADCLQICWGPKQRVPGVVRCNLPDLNSGCPILKNDGGKPVLMLLFPFQFGGYPHPQGAVPAGPDPSPQLFLCQADPLADLSNLCACWGSHDDREGVRHHRHSPGYSRAHDRLHAFRCADYRWNACDLGAFAGTWRPSPWPSCPLLCFGFFLCWALLKTMELLLA